MTSSAHAPARARELGIAPGIFRPGAHNALTDVAGVLVRHTTLNSLFTATPVTGPGLTVEPLPLDRGRELLARYSASSW